MGLNTVQRIPGIYELPGLVLSPSGGKVSFVGSAANIAALGQVGAAIKGRSFTTINQALAECVTGRGDIVYTLPGFTANVDSADWLSNLGTKTDVTVCGLGHNTNRPALTWTAATATLLMDAANFRLVNMQLFLAGPQSAGSALTVAAPITASAAGWEISGCDVFWGFDADQIVTIGITTTAAAVKGKFNSNYCFAETAAVPTTTLFRITGCDQLEIDDTTIIGPGSTTAIGPVQMLTTGSKGMKITNSRFQNTLAASTIAFTAIAGCTGIVDKCAFGVLAAGNGLTTGSGLQVTNSKTAVAAAAGADTTG